MISYASDGEYIYGLRMPTEKLACDGGYKIRVINEKFYFILNTSSNKVEEFSEKELFSDALDKYGLPENGIDYSKFNSFWDRYSSYYKNINFSNCEADASL